MLRCPAPQRCTAGRGQGAPRSCSTTLRARSVPVPIRSETGAVPARSGDRLTSRDEVWAGTETALPVPIKRPVPPNWRTKSDTPCGAIAQFRSSDRHRQIGDQVHYALRRQATGTAKLATKSTTPRRDWQSSDPVGHRGHYVTIPAPSPVQAGQYLPGRGPGTEREPGIPARGTEYRL
jgi:hypothetical protein